MSQMLKGIATGAPVWVWPLLLGMIWLGLRARRPRVLPVWPAYVMPALGVMSVNSVRGLGGGDALWLVFGLAYLPGLLFGQRFQARRILAKTGGRVHLQGEWLTLSVLMLIFWLNFAGGVFQSVAPTVYQSIWFLGLFTALAGSVAGVFLGRALGLALAPERDVVAG